MRKVFSYLRLFNILFFCVGCFIEQFSFSPNLLCAFMPLSYTASIAFLWTCNITHVLLNGFFLCGFFSALDFEGERIIFNVFSVFFLFHLSFVFLFPFMNGKKNGEDGALCAIPRHHEHAGKTVSTPWTCGTGTKPVDQVKRSLGPHLPRTAWTCSIPNCNVKVDTLPVKFFRLPRFILRVQLCQNWMKIWIHAWLAATTYINC